MLDETMKKLKERNVRLSVSMSHGRQGLHCKADVRLETYGYTGWPTFAFTVTDYSLDALEDAVLRRLIICEPIIRALELHRNERLASAAAEKAGKELKRHVDGGGDAYP